MRRLVVWLVMVLGVMAGTRGAWAEAEWRAATAAELERFLPARAPVVKERIETEMRTATGITDGRRTVGAVVLITAGYAAEGKYSHYLLLEAPMRIGGEVRLGPGAYLVGWSRSEGGLLVHFFEAATGREVGAAAAVAPKEHLRVEPFHIWPPKSGMGIQIGRFVMGYEVGP